MKVEDVNSHSEWKTIEDGGVKRSKVGSTRRREFVGNEVEGNGVKENKRTRGRKAFQASKPQVSTIEMKIGRGCPW